MKLTDKISFVYLNYNDEKISVTATAKELIDDWYGECEKVGGNDCSLCETNITGMEMSDATIEDLMEYLVKETGYSEPRIDEKAEDLLKYFDASLVVGLNKDNSNRMAFETKGEVDTIDMLAAIIEGYAIENSLSTQEVLAATQQKIAQKNM